MNWCFLVWFAHKTFDFGDKYLLLLLEMIYLLLNWCFLVFNMVHRRSDGSMVLLQKTFSLDSRCMLEAGGQSTACLSDQLSRDLLLSTFRIVWIKCFGGLLVPLKFFSAGIVPYGMAMEDGLNSWRDLLILTQQFIHSHQSHSSCTAYCQQFVFSLGSLSSQR